MSCSSRAFDLLAFFLLPSMTHRRVYSSIEWARLQRMRVHRRILRKSTRSMWSLSLTISTNSLTPLPFKKKSPFSVTAHVFFRYVVNAAKVAKTDKDQRLIYVSVCSSFEPVGFSSLIIIYFMQTSGANPTSSIFYPRSKGLTEQALAELGYKDTISFRPTALSNTNRPQPRFVETAFLYAPLALSFCPFSLFLLLFVINTWETRC
jgi:hypothetical protein